MKSQVVGTLLCLVIVGCIADILPGENDAYPKYDFAYHVNDGHTGDVKSHQESRDGENVQGQYSLNDADGYKRIVDYTVNGQSGFRAVVRREPLQGHSYVVPQPIEAPKQEYVPVAELVAPPKPLANKPVNQPSAYLGQTIVHHHHRQQEPTVYHEAPVVQLGHATHHIVHATPTATVLKSSPSVITTTTSTTNHLHHHTPAVVHHPHSSTVVHHVPRTSVVHHHTPAIASSPHVSYVHYH
ncbi:uncharacterized protein LOC142233593 [Haematobia irritans]|uniref:uncharacterized protein LOC142233593 n=1 Tax=Haematobia irritans TaxID=7368 RepID=UPI003F50856B